MIRKVLFKTSLLFVLSVSSLSFANAQCCKTDSVKPARSRLTLGGYGEAVASRYFYSDNVCGFLKKVDSVNVTLLLILLYVDFLAFSPVRG